MAGASEGVSLRVGRERTSEALVWEAQGEPGQRVQAGGFLTKPFTK